jgi:hypothetical protein
VELDHDEWLVKGKDGKVKVVKESAGETKKKKKKSSSQAPQDSLDTAPTNAAMLPKVYVYVYIHTCMRLYHFIFLLCVCVCVCVHTHTHTYIRIGRNRGVVGDIDIKIYIIYKRL